MSLRLSSVLSVAALSLLGACSISADDPAAGTGTAGSNATGGQAPAGSAGTPSAMAGSGNPATPTAGSSPVGTGGQAPTGGSVAVAGTASAGTPATPTAGTGGGTDPLPPRPIQVEPGDNFQTNFNGQPLSLNKSKPAVGKLVLLLGGICTGTGAGGFESFVKQYGFHVFAPKTQTCVNSAPDKYKEIIKTMPDDHEANRQVADARMELWDGVDRVDWVTVNKGESIVEQTLAAIQYGVTNDPGGDWGFFLNADGTLRTTDVYVVGYSWGSQSWAMMSSYVRFGRVIVTSGPVAEGFPNGEWMTKPGPNATPGDRKYMLVDLKTNYPSAGDGNMEKFTNVAKAGWAGVPTNVTPTSPGPYTAEQHLFAMIGSNGTSPGGHTVFCNDNPSNGWLPLCKHVLGVQ
jgi:hypothetical protein